MSKTLKRIRKRPGLSPGSLVYTRERLQDIVRLQLIVYDEQGVNFLEEDSIGNVFAKMDSTMVNWINVTGLHDVSLIELIGSRFGIHPLILEDILQAEHPPKFEDHDSYLFLTLKMLGSDHSASEGEVFAGREHVSMILVNNTLITFQEKDGDVFDPIREAIRGGTGRLRKRGADYLFYRLIDTIVDHYYLVADRLEEQLEEIEGLLLESYQDGVSEKILSGKKQLAFLKRSIFPLKDELRKLKQSDTSLVSEGTYRFFDDVYDHLQHIVSLLEGFREQVTSLLELQISAGANRMNRVMKTLTIFAAIFMPLTFIAGIYGMNFHYMPELEKTWAYPAVIALMLIVALSMLVYMRYRKWL